MTSSRTYETTHPWLRFSLDLSQAPPPLWLMLGECASKCEHLANAPLLPVAAEQMQKMYLAKGVQATVAIEGNTLSEEEVRSIVDGDSDIPPSKRYLQQEVSNIITACNEILQSVADKIELPMTDQRLCCAVSA